MGTHTPTPPQTVAEKQLLWQSALSVYVAYSCEKLN